MKVYQVYEYSSHNIYQDFPFLNVRICTRYHKMVF